MKDRLKKCSARGLIIYCISACDFGIKAIMFMLLCFSFEDHDISAIDCRWRQFIAVTCQH